MRLVWSSTWRCRHLLRYAPRHAVFANVFVFKKYFKNRKTRKNLNRLQISGNLWIGLGAAVARVELITRSFSRIDKFRRSRTIG